MKFGVLGGQTLDKINSNKVNRGYCAPLFSLCVPMPRPATRRRLHASTVAAILTLRARGLSIRMPWSLLVPSPSSSSEQSTRARPSRAAVELCADHPSPPRLDSPCPEPHDLAPKLLRASTSSVEPHPRPNQASPPRPPLTTTPSSTPLRRFHSSGHSPTKSNPR